MDKNSIFKLVMSLILVGAILAYNKYSGNTLPIQTGNTPTPESTNPVSEKKNPPEQTEAPAQPTTKIEKPVQAAPPQPPVYTPEELRARANPREAARPAGGVPPNMTGAVRNLEQDERAHGHTLQRHVGRTDAQLIERLKEETDISGASTYTDRAVAEHCVGAALLKNEAKIKAWLQSGDKQNLVVEFVGDDQHPIGRSIRRGKTQSSPCYNAKVVLRPDGRGSYYVLTSYPDPR